MKKAHFTKHLLVMVLISLICSGAVSALTVTATPPNSNISIGMTNAVQIYYRAFELDAPPFSAISTQGRFETEDEFLLGTTSSSVTIQLVNNQGTASESVLVPASVIKAALEINSRIYYRRIFSSIDYGSANTEVLFQIVPSSAGQFSLTRLEMAFNPPMASNSTRPSSGGRITVAKNTRGLTATATLAYNGSGTLRGQWKVDGQIVNHVTQYFNAGIREIAITSPITPSFPTYATGLHRVEFEVIDPAPGFREPVIFYFVNNDPVGPPADSLKLVTPIERDHIQPKPDMLPVFSWQPVGNGLIYHFQIYGIESNTAQQNIAQLDFSNHKPLVAALTKEPSYSISIFDLPRIIPGIPYIWQVKAYDGQTLVATSLSRLVYFTTPVQQTPIMKTDKDIFQNPKITNTQ